MREVTKEYEVGLERRIGSCRMVIKEKRVYDTYLSLLNHFSMQPPTVPALSLRVGVTCVLSLVQQTAQSYVNWV